MSVDDVVLGHQALNGAGQPGSGDDHVAVQPAGAFGDRDVCADVRGQGNQRDVDPLRPLREPIGGRLGERLLQCGHRLEQLRPPNA